MKSLLTSNPETGYRAALDHGMSRRFLFHYGIDRIASWVAGVAILVLTYRLTESIGAVAAVILVQVLARSIVTLVVSEVVVPPRSLVSLASIIRVVAVAALILVTSRADIWWALIAASIVATATGLLDIHQARLIPSLVSRRSIPMFNRLVGRIEQSAAIIGPAIGAVVLILGDERSAFAVAALLFYVSLVLLRRTPSAIPSPAATNILASLSGEPASRVSLPSLSARLQALVTGMVVVAALMMLVRVALVGVVMDTFDYSGWVYALLLGLVGLGALIGPLPVDRLLGHFPSVLILSGGVGILIASAIVIVTGLHVLFIVPVLVLTGLVVVTLDGTAAVVARRTMSEEGAPSLNRVMAHAVVAGQSGTLIAILLISLAWNLVAAVVVISTACALVTGAYFMRVGGLRALGRLVDSTRKRSAGGRGVSG
jgi:hypothetical protein